MQQTQATTSHTLREGNQCVDFMAKLDALSNNELMRHDSPPTELSPLLQNDCGNLLFDISIVKVQNIKNRSLF